MFQYPDTKTTAIFARSFDDLRAQAQAVFKRCDSVIARAPAPSNDSLASGGLGMAYYHYSKFKAHSNPIEAERAQKIIKNILDKLNAGHLNLINPLYSQGLPGLGYVLNKLTKEGLIEFCMPKEFAEVDEYLFQQARRLIRQNRNDYLHGAFGIVFYFSSREQNPTIDQYLTVLIADLLRSKEKQPDSYLIRNVFTHRDPNNYNFSLSHGQTGFILILARLLGRGNEIPFLKDYICHAVETIVKYRQTTYGDNLALFPFELFLDTGHATRSNRLAWCYGDLNHALALYEAADILKNLDFQAAADEVGLASVGRRSVSATLCEDSHFCHGSAGVAQAYRRLYDLRPMPEYKDAYYFWIARTIDFLKIELETEVYKDKETNFLAGLLGPTMVLLSFISDEELDWPRCWLL